MFMTLISFLISFCSPTQTKLRRLTEEDFRDDFCSCATFYLIWLLSWWKNREEDINFQLLYYNEKWLVRRNLFLFLFIHSIADNVKRPHALLMSLINVNRFLLWDYLSSEKRLNKKNNQEEFLDKKDGNFWFWFF
jgi:hypothetical protein